MSLSATPSLATDRTLPARPARAFLLASAVALACGVALAAWAATGDLGPPSGDVLLPRGPLLDRLLDEAQASPTQRAQAHQIFDAADNQLSQHRGAERSDRALMAQLFAQPLVDAVAVEAVRTRLQHGHDADSRRATQALLDVSMVLDVRQRQVIAARLAGGPHPFSALRSHPAAPAAF